MSQKDLAASVVQFTAMQNDVVMFEDFDHGSKHIKGFMRGNDTTDALAKGGVKNLCVETSSKEQPIFDVLNKAGGLVAERDSMPPEKQKQLDAAVDKLTDNYAEYMSAAYKKNGVENNSKEELSAYKQEAESIVYAGSKGIKVHAVDSGVGAEKLSNGQSDFTKANNQDSVVADRVADIAKTGKTAVIYGAAHSLRENGENGENGKKDLDDNLQSKGLKVGRIAVVEDMKQLNEGLNGGTTENGQFKDFKEAPNTVIQTNANGWIPGGSIQVTQLQTDGKNTRLGGEIDRDSKEAENSQYKSVSEKDLGNILPPEVFANAPKATIVNER